MPEFKIENGDTMLIRVMDAHNEAEEMARRLGIAGEVRTMVGRWKEGGQITGWTTKTKQGADEILVEVFISKLCEENREFDHYARDYQKLFDENAELKRQLAADTPAPLRHPGPDHE